MVATVRNWAFDPNHVAAGASEDAQAQDAWFRALEVFRGNVGVDENGTPSSAGAWAVWGSSDSLSAGLVDYIAAPGNIVFAASGNPHSWIVFSRTFGSKTLYVCIDFNDAASPFRTAQVILFPGAPTGGTTTARPTHADEVVLSNSTFFGAEGFVPRHVHSWRSDVGEVVVVMSIDGTAIPEMALCIFRPDNGEAALGWTVLGYYEHSVAVASRGALGQAAFTNSGFWDSFWQDDTPLGATIYMRSILANSATNLWVNGRSNVSNSLADAPIDVVWNSASEAGYMGRIVDWRFTPENVPDNETQDGDTDLVRRITIGEMWAPNRAAAGPLVL